MSEGDALYVLSLRAGQLLLGGRMTVDRVVARETAMRILKRKNLPDADDWVIAKDESGTPLHRSRQLAPDVAKQLRFASRHPEPRFAHKNYLDRQTIRVVRELTKESASLLDEIIEMTEEGSRKDAPLTVSDDQLQRYRSNRNLALEFYEESRGVTYIEGSVKEVLVNRYERDSNARETCIRHHGRTCSACDVDLSSVYGPVAAGFIHVHHLQPLSGLGADYEVDPVEDLRPVCPNCHAIIHLRNPPYPLSEVKSFLSSGRIHR